MPDSNFKARPTYLDAGMGKCPCGQTFNYESEREWKMKIRLDKKSCDKFLGSSFTKKPRKAMTAKELQHLKAERSRELHQQCS